jgi:hypothetical protein
VALGFEKVLSEEESRRLQMVGINVLEMCTFFESVNAQLVALSLWLCDVNWKELTCSYTALGQQLKEAWDIKEFRLPEVGDGVAT